MRVETFKIEDWESPERGLIIDENEDWILVKHIPVDYVIDGYKIYKKSFITERTNSDYEQKIERVLKLKNTSLNKPTNFQFSSTLELLKWAEMTYEILEFQDYSESELFYGLLNNVDGDEFTINMVKSDGSIDPEFDVQFSFESIRVITFETDYHKSIRLLYSEK